MHGVAYGVLRVIRKPLVRQRTSEDVIRRRPPKKKTVKRHRIRLIKPMAPKPAMQALPMLKRPVRRRIVRRFRPKAPPPMAPPPMNPPPMAAPQVVDFIQRAGVNPDLTTNGGGESFYTGTTGLGNPNLPPAMRPLKPAMKPPPPPPPPMRAAPVVVYIKRLPKVVSVPRAPYPEAARKAGVQGSIKLLVTVGTNGRVRRVKVLKGVRPDLDQAAVRALKKARFRPAVGTDGRPMVYSIRYRYTFRLEQ